VKSREDRGRAQGRQTHRKATTRGRTKRRRGSREQSDTKIDDANTETDDGGAAGDGDL